MIEVKRTGADEQCRKNIRDQQAVKTNARTEYGNDLCARGHARCEIDDGNETEKRAEKICEVWNEIEIVIANDGAKRGAGADEVFHFFRKIEHDHDEHDEHNRKCERSEELSRDVQIYFSENCHLSLA
jgi:hypothetical protein